MVIRKLVIPFLAVAGVGVVVYSVVSENQSNVRSPQAMEPARSPYDVPVSGAGLVEAGTQNIAIGTHVPGVVMRVSIKVGDQVKTGDPLFTVDDRGVRAELDVRRAALLVAEQTLSRLQNTPRAEDVPPAESKVAEAEAQLQDTQAQLAIAESAGDSVAMRETSKRQYAVQASRARLAHARAQLDLLKAGAWKEDRAVARTQVELARAQFKASETELERLTVRAPVDGEVLQVNIRSGEFAPAGALATPLMILGDTRTLHLRVEVDENDAWRVRPEAAARASLRGNSHLTTDLTFVRIEPFVVPKKSLTGYASERVDTRVLQVLYSFPRGSLPVYVGQQMDVFIDAPGPVKTEEGK